MSRPVHPEDVGVACLPPTFASVESLTAAECRVLGCLIEKAVTVPDTYPITLNALLGACNQRSSRDPVVAYDETDVVTAVDGLREKRLSRLVHQPGGRAAKHRHRADEELVLDEPTLAVLSVLLLRGPQTVGELRTRSERQFSFGSLDEVGHVLDRLAERDDPLVRILPRQPGQKDQRWTHLLGGETRAPADAPDGPDAPAATRSAAAGPVSVPLEARVERLEAVVASLCAELGIDADLPGSGDGG